MDKGLIKMMEKSYENKDKLFIELKIPPNLIKPNDIVLQFAGYDTYFVRRKGVTFFNKRPYIDVYFPGGLIQRFYTDEMVGERIVLRRLR